MLSPEAELAALLAMYAEEYIRVLRVLSLARLKGDSAGVTRAFGTLEGLFSQSNTLADLYGRRRSWLEFDAAIPGGGGQKVTGPASAPRVSPHGVSFTRGTTARRTVPRLTFQDAVDNLMKREPRLAKPVAGEPMWKAVQRVHEEGGFALAKAADEVVTERVQKALEDLMTGKVRPQPGTFEGVGVARPNPAAVVAEVGDFTEAYADTIVRTTTNTAYNAGRYHQLDDPDIAAIMLAFEYVATRDADVRRGRPQDRGENHRAADGIIAPRPHEIWDTMYPPAGYGCRCTARQVSKFELKRRNMLNDDGTVKPHFPPGWQAARAASGFGGRPT